MVYYRVIVQSIKASIFKCKATTMRKAHSLYTHIINRCFNQLIKKGFGLADVDAMAWRFRTDTLCHWYTTTTFSETKLCLLIKNQKIKIGGRIFTISCFRYSILLDFRSSVWFRWMWQTRSVPQEHQRLVLVRVHSPYGCHWLTTRVPWLVPNRKVNTERLMLTLVLGFSPVVWGGVLSTRT